MDLFKKYYGLTAHYLARRPHSTREVRDYLLKKKAPEDVIEKIIASMQRDKFLNDLDFAHWWREQRTRFRTKSDRVIRMELKQKGIATDIIALVFEEKTEETKNDLEKARLHIEKYSRRFDGLEGNEKYRKIQMFLGSRGFDYETIKQAIDDILERGYNTD